MKRYLLAGLMCGLFTATQAQITNPGMENWRNVSTATQPTAGLESPVGWNSADSIVFALTGFTTPQKQCFKSTTHHSGSFSAKIVSKDEGILVGVLPGILTNGNIELSGIPDPTDPTNSLGLSGGTAISQRVGGVKVWIQYTPAGNDTGAIYIQAVMNNSSTGGTDSVVGAGYSMVTQTSGFSEIFIPVSYFNSTDIPNLLQIIFLSSASAAPQDGTSMYIDDVSFVTTGINDVNKEDAIVAVYPNPAADQLHLSTKSTEPLTWEAYDMQGRVLVHTALTTSATVNLNSLASGVYTYRVSNKQGAVIQNGKFSVAK